jgi:hypothetical protein
MSICSTGRSDSEFGPLVVKPKNAARMLACGMTRVYELLNKGELESFLDGSSRKITVESIRRYIARHLPASEAAVGVHRRLGQDRTQQATEASLVSRRQRRAARSKHPY